MVSTQAFLENLIKTDLKEYVHNVSLEKAKELLSSGEYAQNHSVLIRSCQNSQITIVRAETDCKGVKVIGEFVFTVLKSTHPVSRDGFEFIRQIDTRKYATHMTAYSASTFLKLLAMMEETERRILHAEHNKSTKALIEAPSFTVAITKTL
jgi:hypothetical protein